MDLSEKFLKFTVISEREDLQAMEDVTEDVMFNMSQIVSIKAINIIVNGDVVKGYWLRTTNGKKYRVTEAPLEVESLFSKNLAARPTKNSLKSQLPLS